MTGNIFRADGGPPSFVICLVRDDSTGSLRNPSSTFRLACSGADACQTTAERCARDGLDPDRRRRARPGELLPAAGRQRRARAPTRDAAPASFADALIARLAAALERLRGSRGCAAAARSHVPRSALAQANGGRGATLTLDQLNFLVTKDVGGERWSISYSLRPVRDRPSRGCRDALPERHRQRLPARRQPAELHLLHAARRLDRHARGSRRASSASRARAPSACEHHGARLRRERAGRTISDDVRLAGELLPAARRAAGGAAVRSRDRRHRPHLGSAVDRVAPGFAKPRRAPRSTAPPARARPVRPCLVPRSAAARTSWPAWSSTTRRSAAAASSRRSRASASAAAAARAASAAASCAYRGRRRDRARHCLPFDSGDRGVRLLRGRRRPGAWRCRAAAGRSGGCPATAAAPTTRAASCDPLGGSVACPGVCVARRRLRPDASSSAAPASRRATSRRPRRTRRPTTPADAARRPRHPGRRPTPIATPSPHPTPCLGQGPLCLGPAAPCCDGLGLRAQPVDRAVRLHCRSSLERRAPAIPA